jgi:tetratricopeptide (TPR) repeat protein
MSRRPRALSITCLLAAVIAVCAGFTGADKEAVSAATSVKYADQVKRTYDYRFGSDAFLPSQALSETGEFIDPKAVPSAKFCAKCHEEAYHQWEQSAHRNAFREPFYTRNVNILINTKGIEFSRHCEGCHNPTALFSGALTKAAHINRWFDDEGISCMSCHSIAKLQNTSGTGSYVMGTPTVMLNADGTPNTGRVTFDDILAHPDLHKRAVMKDFYRTPEFCAACHKAAVPRQLNDYKWLRAFSVYDEWQNSSWSKESPLPFYKKDAVSTCQTCHMSAESVLTSDYGAKNGTLKSHRWLAANTAIPTFYGFKEQLDRTIKFLQDDKLAIDIFSLTNDAGQTFAPIDDSSFDLAAGQNVTVGLFIQNKGIGHTLVPEQRDFYESFVEFLVKDAAGKVVAHSGYYNPDGTLDERAHVFANRLISADGKLLDLHQVWLTHTRAYDSTIGPGRSELIRYRFNIPREAKGPLSITARVNYRRFRQGWLDYALQKKGVQYPVAMMAEKSITLQVGRNEGAPAANDQKEMLRWNNYGIALLGQQQYADSAEAFKKVVAMKPDYADGWTNIGIADFSYQKYELAEENLNKALQLDPGNARATFYLASIRKIQNDYDSSIDLFKQVIAKFPRLRDAHRELGQIYYQQKNYEMARQEYEALQSIDVDDLSAHYNLQLIYRRLGMKDKAAEQAKYFAERKDDPAAASAALDFLRANPQISSESVPWHVHDLTLPYNTPNNAPRAPANQRTEGNLP